MEKSEKPCLLIKKLFTNIDIMANYILVYIPIVRYDIFAFKNCD